MLRYPVNFPLLPAASYLHLTASKVCLHLVKMNANLDSISSSLALTAAPKYPGFFQHHEFGI